MLLLNNPFYILNVSTRDNKQKILDAAEEAELMQDSEVCAKASAMLLNPNNRITAEVCWLPCLSPRQVEICLATIKEKPETVHLLPFLIDSNKASCALANASLAALGSLSKVGYNTVPFRFLNLAKVYEKVKCSDLLPMINSERIAAGYPEILDESQLNIVLNDHQRDFIAVFKRIFEQMPTDLMVSGITGIIEANTSKGQRPAYKLVYDLIDYYELGVKSFFEQTKPAITSLIETIKRRAVQKVSDSELNYLVDKLIEITRKWDKIAQPIQVSMQSQGREHSESKDLAYEIRSLSLDLFNDCGNLELSQKLTQALGEIFAEVYTAAEHAKADTEALLEIKQRRAKNKQEESEERRYMNYSTQWGLLNSNRIDINFEQICWCGKTLQFKDITHILWGGISNSVNHIHTGTDHYLTLTTFNDTQMHVNIANHDDVFTAIIDRVWRGCAVRLLVEMLGQLKQGEKILFANVLICDTGVEYEKRFFTKGNKRVFLSWDHVSIGNSPGLFCIYNKDEQNTIAELDYLKVNDLHILETMIRHSFKQGLDRLSDLLE